MIEESKEFEQGLCQAMERQFAEIPQNEEELDFPISAEFQARCRTLLQNVDKPSGRRRYSRLKRALLAAALVAALATSALAIPSVRSSIASLFVNREDPQQYTLLFEQEQIPDAPDRIETFFLPAYLPEGFTESYRSLSSAMVSASWANEDGACISFSQHPIPFPANVHSWLGIDAEHTRWEQISLGSVSVIRFSNPYVQTLAWVESGYFFILTVPSTLPWSETTQMFYHISQVEAP